MNMKTKRHAGRYQALSLLAALALVMSLVTPGANVIIHSPELPEKYGTPDGPDPTISVDMSVDKTEVQPGDQINYTVDATLEPPYPINTERGGESNVVMYELTIKPDANAPLDREPQASDFTWSDGQQRDIT